jgi:hypothetical protein
MDELLLLLAGAGLFYVFTSPRVARTRTALGRQVNAGGPVPQGGGSRPVSEPDGSEPYQQIGVYNSAFSVGFPTFTNNTGASAKKGNVSGGNTP